MFDNQYMYIDDLNFNEPVDILRRHLPDTSVFGPCTWCPVTSGVVPVVFRRPLLVCIAVWLTGLKVHVNAQVIKV